MTPQTNVAICSCLHIIPNKAHSDDKKNVGGKYSTINSHIGISYRTTDAPAMLKTANKLDIAKAIM